MLRELRTPGVCRRGTVPCMTSGGASPTRLHLADRVWEPDDGPVLAVFEVRGNDLASTELNHGIVDGAAGPLIVRMPPLIDRQVDLGVTPIAGGTSLIFERIVDHPDDDGNLVRRGLYRFDLGTSTVSRLPVDPGPVPRRWFTVAATADGSRVVVVTHRHDEPRGDWKPSIRDATTTVWEVTGGHTREVAALRGKWREGDIPNRSAQLSHDGTRLALVIMQEGTWSYQLVILDMATGERVLHHKNQPWGSDVWSPDGRRMLMDTFEGPAVLDLETRELTPLPVAPHRISEPGKGRAFPAGFLDNDHLLIYSERHNYTRDTTTVTLASVPVDGTDRTPLYTWTAAHDQYIHPAFPAPIPDRLRMVAGLDEA